LHEAIMAVERRDKRKLGPDFESGLVGGWKEIRDALKRGEEVRIGD